MPLKQGEEAFSLASRSGLTSAKAMRVGLAAAFAAALLFVTPVLRQYHICLKTLDFSGRDLRY